MGPPSERLSETTTATDPRVDLYRRLAAHRGALTPGYRASDQQKEVPTVEPDRVQWHSDLKCVHVWGVWHARGRMSHPLAQACLVCV